MDRRTVIGGVATLVGASGLTGCLDRLQDSSAEEVPDPIDLSGGKEDDQGGMIIGNHGGPNGQIFYADHAPEGHDNPAWFHTLAFGLFPYHFERERRGWEATIIYVTDYSTVDYSIQEGENRTTITSPTAPDTFGDATKMTYVIQSEVSGGMGPALLPFSSDADAATFSDEHGGQTITFDDITPVFISEYTGR